MAFYDQVALIAGRAIVTIDPLPKQPKPIEHQPVRRVRWWEDNVDEQNKENEAKNKQHQNTIIKVASVPIIIEASTEDLTSSMEELDSIISKKVSIAPPENKDQIDGKLETKTNDQNTTENNNQQAGNKQELAAPAPAPQPTTTRLSVNEPVKIRKKSLRERRMSRSLTINIDRNMELPVIRQLSMPKFYLDTPEVNQTDSSILMAPSVTLMSPVMPRSSQFDLFDLRSVVQLEKEHRTSSTQSNPVPVHKQLSPHSRLIQIKEKLKSTKLKRQGSATNLPNSIHHI